MKKILCIIPPYIPSYFNAGHHLPIFSVGNYLRYVDSLLIKELNVKCVDCAALNYTWKDICDLLIEQFDFIIVLNDFDAIDSFMRFKNYCEELSPKAKTITFGRLSNQIPTFFKQFNFDAIVESGDYESGVLNSINAMLNDCSSSVSGVYLKQGDEYIAPITKGKYLSPTDWVLPDVSEIPFSDYDYMYRDDFKKFCGIPERRELVIPIARGCPVGCSFCDVPLMQGKTERRISIDRTIKYIQDSFSVHPFEYYSFYCPTFTLNKKWVKTFCEKIIQLDLKYPWKCVTVIGTLSEDLVRLMAESGNIRISVGLETLDSAASLGLPKVKQDAEMDLVNVSNWCKKYGVELNCFVILGLPGDTYSGVEYTISKVLELGARVRPTIYTPYDQMDGDMSIEEVGKFNRQFFVDKKNKDLNQLYYKLFYDNRYDFQTKVMNRITERKIKYEKQTDA